MDAQGRSQTAETHLTSASEAYLLTGDTGTLGELLRAKFRRRGSARDLEGARLAGTQAAEAFASAKRPADEAGVLFELAQFEFEEGDLAGAESNLLRSLDTQEGAGVAEHTLATVLLLAEEGV